MTAPCRTSSLLLVLLVVGRISAAPVTLRLVRAEAPEATVSTAATRVVMAADEAERVPQQRGTENVRDAPQKPRAEFERYTNYMRGIVIDGKHPFQRSYQGSFLGRSDTMTLDLADGVHRLDPGNHEFTLRDGKLQTDDPTLRVRADNTLDVLLYPVAIMAIDGAAVRPLPAEVLRLPIAPRIYWGQESLLPREKEVAANATFSKLTLYMIANRIGAGYRISPSERFFHLGPEGLTVVAADGTPTADRAVYVEPPHTLVLPRTAIRIILRGRGLQATLAGPAGSAVFRSDPQKLETRRQFYAFGAEGGANLRFGYHGENGPFLVHGDLGRFPRRQIVLDATSPQTREPRLLAVSLPRGAGAAGAPITSRIAVVDALDADTVTPFQIAAYLYRTPVLQPDSTLLASPPREAPAEAWQPLRVAAGDGPDLYRIHLPETLPSGVYWLRCVASRRGTCSPDAALQVDFIQGVTAAGTSSSLSVFCPTAHHAFSRGTEIPFSVVVKSNVPLAAAALQVWLERAGSRFLVHREDLPAAGAGRVVRHFRLLPAASEALAAGPYTLHAALGDLASNRWPLTLTMPATDEGLVLFEENFCSVRIDQDVPYLQTPESIADANAKRQMLANNARLRAKRSGLEFVGWNTAGHDYYVGRDNSSEAAEVAMLLQTQLGLPAGEVYQYPNHFGAVAEALAGYGMDEINSTPCFSILSLDHSVPDIMRAKARQHQLIAQLAEPYANVVGLNPIDFNTSPLGNSELPDPARHLKMTAFHANFQQQHGYPVPPYADVVRATKATLRGEAPANREILEQWLAYVSAATSLMPDYYALLQQAVRPLQPRLAFSNRGPSWTGGTDDFNYPGIANANQSPQPVFLGCKDGNRDFIWEQYLRIKFHRLSGGDVWAADTPNGIGNLRHNFAMALMGGARGYGYMGGGKPEVADITGLDCAEPAEQQDIRLLARSLGPLFHGLDWHSELAVYYSFFQSAYDTPGGRFSTLAAAHAATMQLAMAGQTTEYISDEIVRGADLARFKVILVPVCYALPADCRERLEAFTGDGGIVLVGNESLLTPAGAKMIPLDFAAFRIAGERWSIQAPLDAASAYVLRELRQTLPQLRQALQPHLTPAAETETDTVLAQTMHGGAAAYTVVCNLQYPSFMGTERLGHSELASFLVGEVNENVQIPQRPELLFPARAVVYDVLDNRRLEGVVAADGRQRIVCDLSALPFRVLAALPGAIDGLRLIAAPTVAVGDPFDLTVEVLSGGTPLTISAPVAISWRDAAGQVAVADTGITGRPLHLRAPYGHAAGTWQLSVRDLISGRAATLPVAVTAPSETPFLGRLVAEPAVMVQRQSVLRDFLQARQTDGDLVWVLLSAGQAEERRPAAEAVVAALRRLQINAAVKSADDPELLAAGERLHPYGANYKEMAPLQYIDHHLALVGGAGESVLLEELQEAHLLARPLSANFPGPARALITIVRSPFAYGRDVLCLLGHDTTALTAGADQLSAVMATSETDSVAAEPVAASGPYDLTGEPKPEPLIRGGLPVLAIAVSTDSQRLVFTTKGYGPNVFCFGADGSAQFEDAIGHVLATGAAFVGPQDLLVQAETGAYLRRSNGTLSAYLDGDVLADPRGHYIARGRDGTMTVYDLALRPLWGFDEWENCASSKEILFGRKATILGVSADGEQLFYRLTGKAPGPAGDFADAIITVNALTGVEQQRVPIDWDAISTTHGLKARELGEVTAVADGYLAEIAPRPGGVPTHVMLFDDQFRLLRNQAFDLPAVCSQRTPRALSQVAWEKRFLCVLGDLLCLSDPDWARLATHQCPDLIRDVAVDLGRQRIGVSTYAGEVTVLDAELAPVWSTNIGDAAKLQWLPDGRLAAGTVRGSALLLGADGVCLWQHDLNRYLPADQLEARWRVLEAAPRASSSAPPPWQDRLAAAVEMAPAETIVEGTAGAAQPLSVMVNCEPFAAYLLTWRVADDTPGDRARLQLAHLDLVMETVAGTREQTAILRPGPDQAAILARCEVSDGTIETAVHVRKLLFPSPNYIRWDAYYDGDALAASKTQPPATVGFFMNVKEQGDPHTSLAADPMALINGRMLVRDPGLKDGRWWGGGSTLYDRREAIVPMFVEITLPRKRILTHIVLAEDPAQPRVEAYAVDVYIDAVETRQEVSAREARQARRGFWHNVVKFRGNDNAYNVFRFPQPVATRTLRIYLLAGHSALTEVEVYGNVPKELVQP